MNIIKLYLSSFAIFLFMSSFNSGLTNNSSNKENTKVSLAGDVLCVENYGYNRISVVLWYKGEAISKLSVGGGQTSCFEIGEYENSWDWKASKGIDGSKKSWYGDTVTFY